MAIDYQRQALETIAKDVDEVFDLIGGDTRERSWPVPKRGGILVSTLGQPMQSEPRSMASGQQVLRRSLVGPSSTRFATIDAGKVSPVLTNTFPLVHAAEAHRYFGKIAPRGKIVLVVDG